MSAWWRANRWYLLALLVLVPVSVVVAMIPRWFPYLERQPAAESVERGDTARYSGADFTLTGLEVLDGDDWGVPEADVVVATLTVDVVDPVQTICELQVVSAEGVGFERFWDEAPYSSDYDVDDRFETRCTLTEAGRYELQLPFLVPADEIERPVVQVTAWGALPRVLRLH